jgi:hypothetical protein
MTSRGEQAAVPPAALRPLVYGRLGDDIACRALLSEACWAMRGHEKRREGMPGARPLQHSGRRWGDKKGQRNNTAHHTRGHHEPACGAASPAQRQAYRHEQAPEEE